MAALLGARPGPAIAEGERYLAEHGVATPRADAELLLMHCLGTDRVGLYGRRETLEAEVASRFERLLLRRAAGEPLQHLTGAQRFCGLELKVRPGVFVPRPETEVLVDRVLEVLRPIRAPVVVDVGTGTGAVALAVRAARPDARVVATDASTAAVALARENGRLLDLEVEVFQGDLLNPLPPELLGRIDVVASNPPYVSKEEYPDLPPEVLADPVETLVGGTEVHERLAGESFPWLRPGGWLLMEIGETQGAEVSAVLARRYDGVDVGLDLAGRDRVVGGRRPRR